MNTCWIKMAFDPEPDAEDVWEESCEEWDNAVCVEVEWDDSKYWDPSE